MASSETSEARNDVDADKLYVLAAILNTIAVHTCRACVET